MQFDDVLRASQRARSAGAGKAELILFHWYYRATVKNESGAAAKFFGAAAVAIEHGELHAHWRDAILNMCGKRVRRRGDDDALRARCRALSRVDTRARKSMNLRVRGRPVDPGTIDKRVALARAVRALNTGGLPIKDSARQHGAISAVANQYQVDPSWVEAAYLEFREYLPLMPVDADQPDWIREELKKLN